MVAMESTVKKVIKALNKAKQPLSLWSIRVKANTNWDSAKSSIDILINKGLVQEVKTSNGIFYVIKGELKC